MSLIDPDTLWWRRNGTRRAVAYLCIALGIVAGFIGAWQGMSMGTERASWIPPGVALVCLFAGIPLLVGGSLIYAFGVDGDGEQLRAVLWLLPLYFIAIGAGSILDAYQTLGGSMPGEQFSWSSSSAGSSPSS